MAGKPLKLFISYSHQDEPLKVLLRQHLKGMERRGLITVWDDRAIPPGEHWEQAIRDELEAADIVLLLLSTPFIASDYCIGEEMNRAVERHRQGQTRLVPVLMEDCRWRSELPIIDEYRIQMLPRDAKAVTDLKHWPSDPRHNLPLMQVADEIERLVHSLQGAAPASPPPPPPDTRPEIPRLLPDLCNRGDQDTAFDLALRASLRQPQRRPFVFVLFGDDAERLHGFRERLALVRIPRVLDLARDQTSVESLTLDMPALAVYRDAADAFRAELANKLLDDRGKSADELFAYLGAHPPPMLLVSHFVGRDGLDKLRKVAAGMLQFWNDWPDLPPGRTLLHCLSVRFEPGADNAAHDEARRLLRRWAAREGGFKEHPRVAGAVLPELGSVQRHHAEEWAELREVRRFAQIQPEDVAGLFRSHPQRKADGSVPMEALYPGLVQLAQQRRG